MGKLWKKTEREVAKMFGGRRIPVNSTENVKCDVSTPVFSIEVKESDSLPNWLLEAIGQAQANCEIGKTALVVLHPKNSRHDKDLVVIEAKYFLKIYNERKE
jgi:hypothetical protein